jgi:ribosome-associated protein
MDISMEDFKLTKEFIELNKLLKFMNIVESGGEANSIIVAGEVMVNNQTEFQKRKKIRNGDVVKVGNLEIRIV